MTEQPDERLGLPSASNWRRYELCAGSWQLEEELNQARREAEKNAGNLDVEPDNIPFQP